MYSSMLFLSYSTISTMCSTTQNKDQLNTADRQRPSRCKQNSLSFPIKPFAQHLLPVSVLMFQKTVQTFAQDLISFPELWLSIFCYLSLPFSYRLQLTPSVLKKMSTLFMTPTMMQNYFLPGSPPYNNAMSLQVGLS